MGNFLAGGAPPPNQAYVEQQLGVKLNWDMRVCAGVVDGIAPANIDPNTWNPTGFDYDQWFDAAISAGANYAVIQTKHHDGFAMWPTQYAVPTFQPYSIAQTTWYTNHNNLDVVGTLVTEARLRGMNPCLYFSAWDLTYEARGGTDETTDAASYIAMIKAQLTELLTNYGDITAIWIDGWKWHLGYTNIPFDTIYTHIKGLQPNCLVFDNNQEHPNGHGDIEIYEAPIVGSIPVGNLRYSEEINTIRSDNGWIWISGADQSDAALRSAATINAAISNAVGNNGTYLLAVTPASNGLLPAAQATRLGEIVVP